MIEMRLQVSVTPKMPLGLTNSQIALWDPLHNTTELI